MPFIFEAKINTEDRNKLPDSAFGIPSKRKYPLTDKDGNLDEKHILQAVRFFNKADESDKEELAKNILKAAKKLKMDYSNWKDVLKYAGEVVEEYMTDSWNLEDAKKICMRIHQKADADKHPLLSKRQKESPSYEGDPYYNYLISKFSSLLYTTKDLISCNSSKRSSFFLTISSIKGFIVLFGSYFLIEDEQLSMIFKSSVICSLNDMS